MVTEKRTIMEITIFNYLSKTVCAQSTVTLSSHYYCCKLPLKAVLITHPHTLIYDKNTGFTNYKKIYVRI